MRLHNREPLPHEREALDRQPPCNAQITICVEAWHDLSTERALGYGIAGMIPWSAVVKWAEVHGFDRESFDLLWSVIQRLDAARVERETSERKLNSTR